MQNEVHLVLCVGRPEVDCDYEEVHVHVAATRQGTVSGGRGDSLDVKNFVVLPPNDQLRDGCRGQRSPILQGMLDGVMGEDGAGTLSPKPHMRARRGSCVTSRE